MLLIVYISYILADIARKSYWFCYFIYSSYTLFIEEYQRTVRNRQIERAKKLLDLKDPEEIKRGPNDVKRFMKRVSHTKSGEKAVVEYTPDKEKITEGSRLFSII